jgi:hypothetical protein
MPIAKEVIGVQGDECQCGRRATVRHCIRCGSTRIYARMDRLHTFKNGSQKYVPIQLRCQGCGLLFVEEEREFCDAPPVGPKLAAQKVRALQEASLADERLTPMERVAAASLMKAIKGGASVEEAKPTMSSDDRNILDNELRKAHFAHLLAYNNKERFDHPGPLEEYVKKGFEQFEQDWIKASQA